MLRPLAGAAVIVTESENGIVLRVTTGAVLDVRAMTVAGAGETEEGMTPTGVVEMVIVETIVAMTAVGIDLDATVRFAPRKTLTTFS